MVFTVQEKLKGKLRVWVGEINIPASVIVSHESTIPFEHQLADSAAVADFCLALYNPVSRQRQGYLAQAAAILLAHKAPATVCGLARQIGRPGQQASILTLAELVTAAVDMSTTVFVGNSQTQALDGKMVTPRGYRLG